ncbi:MAG: N-6 DNA methylase [Treponema sp.]|nr:N-6 DNA methylase [Treponema sp.]
MKTKELVHRFADQHEIYKKQEYNETQTRRDFIDPFWEALGWDVANKSNSLQSYREVIHEDKVKVSGSTKLPDYSFRLPGGKRMFFLEAKKPHTNIKEDADSAIQVRRYGWSAGLSISILTNFDYFAIYDCTVKTKQTDKAGVSRIMQFEYTDYITKFDFFWDTFSRARVQQGGLDKYIQNEDNKKGTSTVDKDFLDSLDKWRIVLAKDISINNEINEDELNYVVQNIINRIIFLRIAEDRHIEPYGQLMDTIKSGDYYKNILSICNTADQKYNSSLFDFKKDTLSEKIIIQPKTIKSIISELYPPICPYEFSVMAVEILGSAYEQFLGKEISLSKSGRAVIEEKPEVRKAGGVYYTPQYIVDFIVKNTVESLIGNLTPLEVSKIKIVDPACGSGSFLIGAYQYLLNWHKDYYNKNEGQDKGKKNSPLTPSGELTTEIKKKILLNNIFGVDLDTNAVEVSKLSLLLKCMEGETKESIEIQANLFHDRVLPDLDNNIKCGNSLIGLDYYDNNLDFGEEKKVKPFSWEKNFPSVFVQGGFDCVIGNPPYVKEYTSKETFDQIKQSHLLKYYQGKMDLWYFFVCYGIDLLKPNGILGYIVPNNWVTNAGSSILRNKILEDSIIKNIIDFGSYMVFDSASIQTMVLILEKKKQASYSFDYRKLDLNKPAIQSAYKLLGKEADQGLNYLMPSIIPNDYKDKYLVFGDRKTENLLNKIQAKKNFVLDGKEEVTNGIHPHYDFVSKQIAEKSKGKYVKGQGIFGLSHKEKKSLRLTKDEKLILKPYYNNTEQLGRYYGDNENKLWIIYTTSDFKNPSRIKNYPNLKKHLDQFKNIITSDNKPYGLHRSREEKFFKGEKIMAIRKCSEPTFTYTDFDCYASAAFYIIKTKRINQMYLTALLNSKTVAFWLKNKGKMQGNIFQVDKEPILNIPLLDTNDEGKKSQVIKYAKLLLNLYKELQNATLPNQKEQLKTQILHSEDKINKIFYELYKLTHEEIRIIENV